MESKGDYLIQNNWFGKWDMKNAKLAISEHTAHGIHDYIFPKPWPSLHLKTPISILHTPPPPLLASFRVHISPSEFLPPPSLDGPFRHPRSLVAAESVSFCNATVWYSEFRRWKLKQLSTHIIIPWYHNRISFELFGTGIRPPWTLVAFAFFRTGRRRQP